MTGVDAAEQVWSTALAEAQEQAARFVIAADTDGDEHYGVHFEAVRSRATALVESLAALDDASVRLSRYDAYRTPVAA